MYPVFAQVTGTELVEVDLDADFAWEADVVERIAASEPTVVVLANPNNPTGMPVPPDVIGRLHDACSGALIVMDEAYVEFAGAGDGSASAAGLLADHERLAISRTFSKAFRLAGLRLGYLLTHEWVVDAVRRVRLPYHLDSIKQVAAEVALEREGDFLEHRGRVAAERERVHAALESVEGVVTWPSEANFVLFRVDDPTGVFDGLLERGVLVRDFSTRRRLEGCLRVTIGTADENDAFLAALADVLAG
jgi:histidinol-phosphate aminotransferase